ncbi:hypothetical protein ACRS6B_24255 [Nocardia asteroides]
MPTYVGSLDIEPINEGQVMTQPTPWQTSKIRRQQAASRSSRDGRKRRVALAKARVRLRPLLSGLGRNAGYLGAAAGSIVTFMLLFEPWLTTGGPDGTIYSNAFGQTHITTTLVGLWSQKPPAHTNLGGKWAILASIAIFLTVFAAVINLWARTEALARLATGSAVAVALFIAFTLVYLNSKGPELRSMIGSGPPTDMGTQIGFVIRWASGNGQYPLPGLRKVEFSTAKLTGSAMLAGVTAMFSAVAAIAQWFRSRKARGPNSGHPGPPTAAGTSED